MTEQASTQFRADKELKQIVTRADGLRAFHKLREQAADLPEMTLDEINAVIAEVRAERKAMKE